MRVGRIEFVNCFPLYHHFAGELAARGVGAEIVEGYPAALNEMLVDGAIDVTLSSSIAFARNADEQVLLPQVSISSFGAVDSIQLFARTPLAQIRRVALTEKSATSICLLKVLCREWGIEPEFAPRRGPLSEVLEDFDALLLIGDEALHLLRVEAYPHHFDLGAEWKSVTGPADGLRRLRRAPRLRRGAAGGGRRRRRRAPRLARRAARRLPQATAAAAAQLYDFSQAYLHGLLRQAQVRVHAGVPRRPAGVLPARRRHRRARARPRPRGVHDGRVLRRAMSCTSLIFRRPIPDDWERVVAVMPAWWDGRDLRALLPRIFFEHFRSSSLLVEHEDALVGFLVGFFCPDHADEAYVHFVGVAPAWRRAGLARDLYRRFFGLARADGRSVVRAVTAPVNDRLDRLPHGARVLGAAR